MNYEKDIKIDESALDVEWLEQPALMMRYARYLAQTEKQLDIEKSNLDIVRADLDKDIRCNPEKYDIQKITESVVANLIPSLDQYKHAYEVYLDAKYDYSMARNAVTAIHQRKDALENLVKLYASQYFAGPSIPRDITWEREQKQKRANESVTKKMTRKN